MGLFYYMKLINIDNYELKVADEALLVKPIRDLFNEDDSFKKEEFYKQMSYLYFMIDPRSSYNYIVDEKERSEAIIEQEGLKKTFKPNKTLKEAMKVYAKLVKTASSELLNDSIVTITKVREVLKGIDFNQLEEKDKVPALKNAASIVAMIPKMVKDLTDAEKAVNREIEESGRARGGNRKTLAEDGFDFMNFE